ncbi:SDR family oxidoreductase [Pseudomonas sp. MAFF212428]|uniref:SDR family oxidoreductase n=1 Tax=Pseudomonas brassicae TaxID=2708063 RepID=A0A6M0CWR2_9PSED|nr:SDR family oxidoreductase [Pseudomonas brassicae]
MTPHSIFLTGASGFVGRTVLKRLIASGCSVTAALRANAVSPEPSVAVFEFERFDDQRDWVSVLTGHDIVIHCAARVHVMQDDARDPLAAYRRVNVDGTLALARHAAAAGVKRFIFLSSIKVNGEGTGRGHAYCADDVPAPCDPYGISKLEAEQGLHAVGRETGMEVVVIRPVLVYGPGVKANVLSMMRWIDKGVPLPFGAIDNRRSLVAVDNLVDLISVCVDHPRAANQTFLVSDGEDVSTSELLRNMARALNKPCRLLPVPQVLLRLGATLIGKRALSQRLCGSLQADIKKTRSVLDWTPPLDMETALNATAQHYQEDCRK